MTESTSNMDDSPQELAPAAVYIVPSCDLDVAQNNLKILLAKIQENIGKEGECVFKFRLITS